MYGHLALRQLVTYITLCVFRYPSHRGQASVSLQEDAVVLNRSAAQRGLFTTTYYHTVREQLAKNHSSGEEEVYYKPDDTTARGMQQCFGKIQADGFPLPGTRVGPQDVIIGKGMPNRGECIADSSVALRANEGGFVDKVVHSDKPYRTTNGDGYSFCKVRIIEPREPQIGDKLSSRSGQKGTIGMTVSQEDLPWTETGLVPDVIINPHAFPSRMTVGMVCEAILGKLACKVGCFGDGTPFTDVNARDICERLRQEGMEMMGDEVMYDPRTGRQWPVAIFVTPTCYQRLKHMVHDKVRLLSSHCRRFHVPQFSVCRGTLTDPRDSYAGSREREQRANGSDHETAYRFEKSLVVASQSLSTSDALSDAGMFVQRDEPATEASAAAAWRRSALRHTAWRTSSRNGSWSARTRSA